MFKFALRYAYYCCLYLSVSIPFPAVSLAQAVKEKVVAATPADGQVFNESYDPLAAVSGSPLVGLKVGALSGSIDVENIVVSISALDGEYLCVRSTTQDGRYFADNAYVVRTPTSRPARVKLTPFTKSLHDNLSRYSSEQLAVRTYRSASSECRPFQALNFPQISSSVSALPQLHTFANSRGRSLTAQLSYSLDNKLIRRMGRCRPSAAGARISFDKICSFELPENGGLEVSLLFSLDDGFETESRDFRIWLPGSGS